MSNYIKIVTTTEIEKKYKIYGGVLERVDNDNAVVDILNYSHAYTYALETNINYDKLSQAKADCPELYVETEKLYADIYSLVNFLLSSREQVSMYLAVYGKAFDENSFLEMSATDPSELLGETFEFDFNIIYSFLI